MSYTLPDGVRNVGGAGGQIVVMGSETSQSETPVAFLFLALISAVPDTDVENEVTGEPDTVVDALHVEPPSVEVWYSNEVATGEAFDSVTVTFVPPDAATEMDCGADGVMEMAAVGDV
jgi:hypothetical protein